MKDGKVENINYKIGQNAVENWEIFDNSKKSYLFFHLSSFPSCYVILEWEEEYYPNLSVIKEVAELCKNNTKYKNLRDIKVDFTQCDNIEKGGNVGEIIYKSNKKVNQIKI